MLLSLNYPQRPANLEDPESESLRVLRDRAAAPTSAAALSKAGVRFAFHRATSAGRPTTSPTPLKPSRPDCLKTRRSRR